MSRSTQAVAAPIEIPREVDPHGILPLAPSDGANAWMWLLWDRRWLVARAALWGLVVSTVIAFLIPKRFESTTRLMPPDSQSSSGMAMMAALAGGGVGGLGFGSLAGDLLGIKSSGALFVDILGGRTVQDRLVDRFDLRRVYHERYWEDARKDLTKFTAISEDRKSGVITIAVTDHDAHRAAEMAQAYVEELDRLVAQVSTSSARRERIFIEQRLQGVKQGLDEASRQFSEYASKNTTIDISAQGKATVEAAARLEGELIAAQSELEGLEQIYSNSHVRVRAMRARVDELRAELHKIGGDVSDPPGDPHFTSDKNSNQEFPSIRQLPLLGVKWADLYRETKVQETVYELLTKQYELAKIQEAKEIPTVKVLDSANVPEKKSFPPRLLLMIIGVLLALSAITVWILGESIWQEMDPADSRKQLGREVIGRLRNYRAKWNAQRWWRESSGAPSGHV